MASSKPERCYDGRHRPELGARGSGTARDSQDTLELSAARKILPKIETYPLGEANAAYQRMIENRARFRVVLTL